MGVIKGISRFYLAQWSSGKVWEALLGGLLSLIFTEYIDELVVLSLGFIVKTI